MEFIILHTNVISMERQHIKDKAYQSIDLTIVLRWLGSDNSVSKRMTSIQYDGPLIVYCLLTANIQRLTKFLTISPFGRSRFS